MRVVCQNGASTFAVHFLKKMLKIEKDSRRTTEIVWEMEKMSYITRLWGYLKKKKSMLKVYTYFTKWDMPSTKGFVSLPQEDTSRAGVQKKPDKFRLEMRYAVLMLTIITHCNKLQNEMVGPPSPDTLQRSRCLSVAHYCIEDSLAISGWNSRNLYWTGYQ